MTPEIESLFRDVDQAKPDMRATWAYLVNHDSGSKTKPPWMPCRRLPRIR